jgi:hypothetical protein
MPIISPITHQNADTLSNNLPLAVRKLLGSRSGGRLRMDVLPWKLTDSCLVSPGERERASDDEEEDDNESVASKGSTVTVIDSLELT